MFVIFKARIICCSDFYKYIVKVYPVLKLWNRHKMTSPSRRRCPLDNSIIRTRYTDIATFVILLPAVEGVFYRHKMTSPKRRRCPLDNSIISTIYTDIATTVILLPAVEVFLSNIFGFIFLRNCRCSDV